MFALGVVLYEMLSGRRAFQGDSTIDRMSAVLQTDPSPLLTLNPALSPILDRLVAHCLCKSPDERFQAA